VKAHLLLVLVTLIWGSTFVLVKAALADASPLLLNAVRMSLAAILLGGFYRRQVAQIKRPALSAGATVGTFLFLGYAFQTAGLKLTTPSKSAFLTGVSTVLVPLLLVIFWRTKIHPWRALGIALALAGLFLMTVPAGRQGLADFTNINSGDLLTIGCATAFAFQIILLGRSTQRFPFEQMAFLQVGVAAALMAGTSPLLEKPHFQLSSTVMAAVVVTGVFGTAVAFTVQAWAQQFTPATHAALIFTLEPVFAWLTSFLYMKERLGIRSGAGALLILAGVLVSELLGQFSQADPETVEFPQPISQG
jgi:drug/metabolite transporter (DMT)-like permease